MHPPTPGLRANIRQFILLVVINGFVGAMVGLERAVLPLVAEQEFAIASKTAILTFIFSFGIVKAFSNLAAGTFADRIGRRKLLLLGWLVGLPVPFMLAWAPSWGWIIAANLLLGVNQGLCWSTTVIMKIDLVGPARRGLAMGLNEFAGYLSLSGAAWASGMLASNYGLRPYPFLPGIALGLVGLLLSLAAKETMGHVEAEAAGYTAGKFKAGRMVALNQAGCINNLNDGAAWGLLPLFLAAGGLGTRDIAAVVAVYPAVWGVFQVWTGALSDRWGRQWLIVWGMWLQGFAFGGFVLFGSFAGWMASSVVLGLGTAMVYPNLLAAVSDLAHPAERGTAVGAYRFWRDMGYPLGAVLVGITADASTMAVALGVVGILTFVSGFVVQMRGGKRS